MNIVFGRAQGPESQQYLIHNYFTSWKIWSESTKKLGAPAMVNITLAQPKKNCSTIVAKGVAQKR